MSDQLRQANEKKVLSFNQEGLSNLANQQSGNAFEAFKKAEKILLFEMQVEENNRKQQQLLAITYNNLAIYYKRTNKPKAALTYLKKALEIETLSLEDWLATATTHLNICAIYSFVGKHEEAIEHAQLSIQNAEKAKSSNSSDQKFVLACKRINLASNYNLAVENQYLKKFQEALEIYKHSKQLARDLNRKDILANSEGGIERMEKTIKHNNRHKLEMILKRKQMEEKGNYDSMRRNKKHFGNYQGEESIVQTRAKKYELYNEKTENTKRGTKSVTKLKKTTPLKTEGQQMNQQSSLPDIKQKHMPQPKKLNSSKSREMSKTKPVR